MEPLVIAIAGPSGSGKSLLTRALKSALESSDLGAPQSASNAGRACVVVPEDAYYHSQGHLSLAERALLNFDHPSSLDHDFLLEQLGALKRREPVSIPVYDYASHTRAERSHRLEPADVVLVEGCLLLSQAPIRELIDASFFIDADLELCLQRRIARDTRERGRTAESVQQQFESTVRPMYHAFLAPCARHAGTVISGDATPQQALEVALAQILPLLK